jgi:hypothetical protein
VTTKHRQVNVNCQVATEVAQYVPVPRKPVICKKKNRKYKEKKNFSRSEDIRGGAIGNYEMYDWKRKITRINS